MPGEQLAHGTRRCTVANIDGRGRIDTTVFANERRDIAAEFEVFDPCLTHPSIDRRRPADRVEKRIGTGVAALADHQVDVSLRGHVGATTTRQAPFAGQCPLTRIDTRQICRGYGNLARTGHREALIGQDADLASRIQIDCIHPDTTLRSVREARDAFGKTVVIDRLERIGRANLGPQNFVELRAVILALGHCGGSQGGNAGCQRYEELSDAHATLLNDPMVGASLTTTKRQMQSTMRHNVSHRR